MNWALFHQERIKLIREDVPASQATEIAYQFVHSEEQKEIELITAH